MLNTLKNMKVKALVDFLPGWVLIGLASLGGGIWGYIQSSSADVLKDASGGNWKGLEVIAVHALIAGLGTALAYLKTDPWATAQLKKVAVPPVLPILMLVCGIFCACTPAQTAELKSIENVVLADVEAGAQDPQIVADVVKIVAQDAGASPAVTAFATALAYDAITFLIDSGIIPANYLASAKTHQASLKLAAGK